MVRMKTVGKRLATQLAVAASGDEERCAVTAPEPSADIHF
jgi:hypothetical protein